MSAATWSGTMPIVVGPTCAGKTALAMALCDHLGGEIVSADSVQVYRRLDVGSAKPTAAEQRQAPHHCIDILDVDQRSDTALWRDAAQQAIAEIISRGRVPVVCGGTGLYIRALLRGLAPIPPVDTATQDRVAALLSRSGAEGLARALEEADPVSAARLPAADTQRVGRALGVAWSSGRPISAWQQDHQFAERPYPGARVLGLWPDRAVLYPRINARAEAMVRGGMIAEVSALLAEGVAPDAPGLSTLGYRAVVAHLRGSSRGPTPALIGAVAQGHRRYAKRQLTWFRGAAERGMTMTLLDPTDQDAPDLLRLALAAIDQPAPT